MDTGLRIGNTAFQFPDETVAEENEVHVMVELASSLELKRSAEFIDGPSPKRIKDAVVWMEQPHHHVSTSQASGVSFK